MGRDNWSPLCLGLFKRESLLLPRFLDTGLPGVTYLQHYHPGTKSPPGRRCPMIVKIFILNFLFWISLFKRHMTKTRQNQRRVTGKVIETEMEGECKTRGHPRDIYPGEQNVLRAMGFRRKELKPMSMILD